MAAAVIVVAPISVHAEQEAGMSQAAIDAGQTYARALESAASAFAGRDFPKALEKLDDADEIHANIPETWNMRGAIYAEEGEFTKAEDAFQKAASLTPSDFWPPYNLAELLMLEKKYSQAATAFQKLEVYQGHDELVQFKEVFANVLAGNKDAAKKVLDAMKFPGDTPAYYFAHSAWGFASKDEKEGHSWVRSAIKVFGPEKCIAFYDQLVRVGWLQARGSDGAIPDDEGMTGLPAAKPQGLLPQ